MKLIQVLHGFAANLIDPQFVVVNDGWHFVLESKSSGSGFALVDRRQPEASTPYKTLRVAKHVGPAVDQTRTLRVRIGKITLVLWYDSMTHHGEQ